SGNLYIADTGNNRIRIVGPTLATLATTTSSLTSSAASTTFDGSVTFTDTVHGTGGTPTGVVTFEDGTTSIGTGTLSSGVAGFTTSSLSVASSPHTIRAVYGGDANFSGSTSNSLTQIVAAEGTSTILGSSASQTTFGTSVTFTARVTGAIGFPTGVVTFVDGTTSIGTGTLSSGVAGFVTSSLSVAGSPHTIRAVYGGDANFSGSTSNSLTQIVAAEGTSTILGSSASQTTFGTSVTFTARVTGAIGFPTGVVTFEDGTTSIGTGTLSSGVAGFVTSSLSAAGSPHT